MLTEHFGVPPTAIRQEFPVEINGTAQRADIVVFRDRTSPLLLVECKAPHVVISQTTCEQAFRYNSVIKSTFVMLTNGKDTFLYDTRSGEPVAVNEFPDLARYYTRK